MKERKETKDLPLTPRKNVCIVMAQTHQEKDLNFEGSLKDIINIWGKMFFCWEERR